MFTSHSSQRGSFVLPEISKVSLTAQQRAVQALADHARIHGVTSYNVIQSDTEPVSPNNADIWLSSTAQQYWDATYSSTVATNQVINPDPGVDPTNWSGVGVSLSIDDSTTLFPPVASMRGTVDGTTSEPTLMVSNQPCVGGTVVTLSLYTRSTALSGIKTFRMEADFFTGLTPVGSFPGQMQAADASDEWIQATLVIMVPAGADNYSVMVAPTSPDDVQAGDTIFLGFVACTSDLLPFFCGSMSGVTWDGTPGASTSTFTPSWQPTATLDTNVLDLAEQVNVTIGEAPLTPTAGDYWIDANGLLKIYSTDIGDWQVQVDPGIPSVQKLAEDAAANADAIGANQGQLTDTVNSTASLVNDVSAQATQTASDLTDYKTVTDQTLSGVQAGFDLLNSLGMSGVEEDYIWVGDNPDMATVKLVQISTFVQAAMGAGDGPSFAGAMGLASASDIGDAAYVNTTPPMTTFYNVFTTNGLLAMPWNA